MAKGHRGKTQTATPNGQEKAKNNKAADKENSTDTQNLQSLGKGRNRNRDKPALINEEQKPESLEENNLSQMENEGQRKEATPHGHSKVQPTTEQLMIAKIIQGHSDDPHQQKKIQQVIDVTGKPEDEVATALFDAGWDENKAVELLLEDGDHLSAWEETGKKKKTKKAAVEENDGWGGENDGGNDSGPGPGNFQDPREKGSRQRGPPRMQSRGRGRGGTKGERTGNDGTGGYTENGDQGPGGRGGRGRRRDQPPRRGGRGGGGGRGYSNREQSNGAGGPGGHNSGDVGGFQGSIDTWANPNEQNSGENKNSRDVRGNTGSGDGGGGGSGGPRGERPHRGGGRSGHGQSNKDAFDNAGNWGDDFPQANEWDNEEYSGSLANTKVFTASGHRSADQKQRTPQKHSDQQQQQPQQPPPQQALNPVASVASPPKPVGAISQRPGDYSAATLAAKDPSVIPSTYPQSIDLSTLLQKPTTQSSVESSAVPGAKFNQQATETLKAAIGIGQTSSNMSQQVSAPPVVQQQMPATQDPNSSALYSYAQAPDFNSIKSQGQGSQPLQPKGHVVPGVPGSGTQMQPRSSSKAPAVEMPGDSLGRLDVQFGGLDLQFGGSGTQNNDAMNKNSQGAVEFGSASVTQQDPHKTGSNPVVNPMSSKPVTDSFAPTAKEVNKTLSNALSSTGKLNPMSGSTVPVASAVNPNQSNQQDSFSKSLSSVAAPTAINVSSVPSLNHTTNSAPNRTGGGGTGGGTSFNKQGQSENQGLSGYSGYNSYNKASSGGGSYGNNYQQYQQYPNSNSFSSQQQQQGSAGTQSASSSTSQYKGAGQYDKYDPSLTNQSAAALGLANTNTTNALSGKVSATTASKVNMPNLPPGVASMLHPQYLAAAGLAPAAAFYGLQQPMYGAYGNTGLGDLAAMPTTGYYDPNNHFAPTTLGAAMANRDLGNTNLANLNSLMAGSTSSSTGTGNSGNSTAATPTTLGSTSSFRSVSSATSTAASAAVSASSAAATPATLPASAATTADSTSSTAAPNAATSIGSTGQAGTVNPGVSQHHSVQQQAQQQQQQQQQFNLAASANAFAAQQMPAGYAYYFGNMGNMSLQPYGANTPGQMYQPTAMTVPGAGAPASQFQKSYGTSYGSGYDALSQQAAHAGGNKDFSSNYPSNGQSKSTGGSTVGGTAKGAHQYWGNTLTGTQLW